jgi:type VI secretion system protein ImpB
MAESIQHKLDRVRPPRVQITYDVQIGDAFEVKELPFVAGVLADLSGSNTEKPKWGERRFVEIDRDSFKDVFARTKPMLQFTVPDMVHPVNGERQSLSVAIGSEPLAPLDVNKNPLDALLDKVRSEDPLYMFHPLWIIGQSPVLRTLYEARGRLSDLLTKLDGNSDLREELVTAAKSVPADLKLDAASYPAAAALPGGAKQIAANTEQAAAGSKTDEKKA